MVIDFENYLNVSVREGERWPRIKLHNLLIFMKNAKNYSIVKYEIKIRDLIEQRLKIKALGYRQR